MRAEAAPAGSASMRTNWLYRRLVYPLSFS